MLAKGGSPLLRVNESAGVAIDHAQRNVGKVNVARVVTQLLNIN
jgi:hypothetical protein